MARKRVELSDIHPYHVCARSNNRTWFDIPLSQVFGIYANVMEKAIEKYEIECHGFVLMANHFHMLISTPKSNLSQAMRYFMTETSRAIARSSHRINRIYGQRYHWTIIKTAEHYAHVFYYIYRNPIRHRAVSRLNMYRWSTLHPHHRKFNTLIVPKNEEYDVYIPQDRKTLIQWLESIHDEKYENAIATSLTRHEFTFPQDRISGKRISYVDKLHPRRCLAPNLECSNQLMSLFFDHGAF
ncbi:MAG: transposase [Bdellovibrionota bacterium]